MCVCMCTGSPSRTFKAKKLESLVDLPLYIINTTYSVLSVTRCLQLCHDQGDCLMFAYQRTAKMCAITSTAGTEAARTSQWDSNHSQWFYIT